MLIAQLIRNKINKLFIAFKNSLNLKLKVFFKQNPKLAAVLLPSSNTPKYSSCLRNFLSESLATFSFLNLFIAHFQIKRENKKKKKRKPDCALT